MPIEYEWSKRFSMDEIVDMCTSAEIKELKELLQADDNPFKVDTTQDQLKVDILQGLFDLPIEKLNEIETKYLK